MAHPNRGAGETQESGGDEPAIVELAGEHSDHRHDADRPEPARAHGQTRRPRGITHNSLIKQRQNRDKPVNHAAEHGHHDAAQREITILENFEIDDWMRIAKLMDQERDESGYRD